MSAPTPGPKIREGKARMVTWSLLVPGAGHLLLGRRRAALAWFAACQVLLFGGFILAGATQLDYGRWLGFGPDRPAAFDKFYTPGFREASLSAFQRSYAYVLAHGLDAVNADSQSLAHLHENCIAAATSERYFA